MKKQKRTKFAPVLERLPLAVIAGYNVQPKLRQTLINDFGDYTLLDAMTTGTDIFFDLPPSYRSRIDASIDKIASHFEGANPKRTRHDKITWVIPWENIGLKGHLKRNRETRQTIDHILADELNPQHYDVARKSMDAWMPTMSFGGITLLRRWRRPKINALRRAIIKLSAHSSFDRQSLYPWDDDFDRLLGMAPVQCLYAKEPTRLVSVAAKQLSAIHINSINDLRILHPDCIALIKSGKAQRIASRVFLALKS